jgi:hypothetical protein
MKRHVVPIANPKRLTRARELVDSFPSVWSSQVGVAQLDRPVPGARRESGRVEG